MADYETLHVCRLHVRDVAIRYKVYLLKLTMAVDNIVVRMIKGAFYVHINLLCMFFFVQYHQMAIPA